MNKLFDLTGKTALVTGGGGGIGAAIAKALASHGASVIIAGRNEEKLTSMAGEIGGDTKTIVSDLSKEDAPEQLAKNALDVAGGTVDILVNNAGITKDTLAMRMSNDAWNEVLTVNLNAPFLLAKALMRPMMKSRSGRIINITSIVGTTGNPGQANYCAAKAGVTGWSKSLASEIAARGITVNCIAPGFIETPMTQVLTEDQKSAISSKIPSGRLGNPEDIASAAVYLASDSSSYVTGQTLHVNGGMAMI